MRRRRPHRASATARQGHEPPNRMTDTHAANFLCKRLIARARPLIEDLPPLVPTISGLSTPSAHASTSFAAASSLGEALPRLPLWAAALVMTLSRPYMGVHYPSDSLAGAVLGALVAREARRAHRRLARRGGSGLAGRPTRGK